MKRIERHRLKENELARTIRVTREFVKRRRRLITGALVAVVVGIAVMAGVSFVRQRQQARGQELLAEAMVALNARVVPVGAQGGEVPAAASLAATGTFPTEEAKLQAAIPKLKAAADAYPDSRAGITARYHLGGAYAALGQYQEAIAAFDEVIRRAGANTLYGRMARLGKADAQARAGQLDAAISAWKEMAAQEAGDLPVDAILIQLARAYLQQGNTGEARKTLTQLVEEHPDSPYTLEAREELEHVKG
jgi:tetratricopeptide (TPR) repeat protein